MNQCMTPVHYHGWCEGEWSSGSNISHSIVILSPVELLELDLPAHTNNYVSVGVSSISPTFPRVPFHSNILSNTSLTSPSPAVLVQRYSGTPEHWSSWSAISELSVCPYLIIVHSTTYFSVPSSFLAMCLPQTSAISSLFLFRSFNSRPITCDSHYIKCFILSRQMVAPVC